MKRALRIIIPFILTLTIILCLVWYLFVYDRGFTRDMLLSCARYCENQGNHSFAAWLYDRAYDHANDNDAVAIELAEQYKSIGNYTKAEYTLSNAISDGGGLDLYIALCKTYVEQDKLLDAVNMLNNITNPEVKAQLERLRPAAPSTATEPGFYNQYISVSIEAKTGKLYVTTNGEYPSLDKNAYTAPITLSDGENTITAIAVADNGLVSPVSVFGYNVGGVVEKVVFSDKDIEATIREALNVDKKKELLTSDLWKIKELALPKSPKSFADLKYLVFLEKLTITKGPTKQLQCLSSLTNLKDLTISGVSLNQDELKAIAALPKLESLKLNKCSISNITAISAAKNLVSLNLNNNSISNISALSELTKLEELNLANNAIVDLKPLSTLVSLKTLNIHTNAVSSLAPLSSLSNLNWLDAGTNSIKKLGEMKKLTELEYLNLESNKLETVKELAGCAKITDLNLSNNKLASINPLITLPKLMYLDASYNKIPKLPTWDKKAALVSIDCSYNELKSLTPLSGLKNLNNVFADYNKSLKLIDGLEKCPNLIQVNVFGTKVTKVSKLTKQSIIVNYNPVK